VEASKPIGPEEFADLPYEEGPAWAQEEAGLEERVTELESAVRYLVRRVELIQRRNEKLLKLALEPRKKML